MKTPLQMFEEFVSRTWWRDKRRDELPGESLNRLSPEEREILSQLKSVEISSDRIRQDATTQLMMGR